MLVLNFMVMSDKAKLELKDGKVYNTGFYLNELMQPVKRFIDQGHQVTFSTPGGLAPTLDANSNTVTRKPSEIWL
jgi:putative intracellular protease/amidase